MTTAIARSISRKGRKQVHLKRLEIHGFKSFADKTVLEFKPGVTIVVGPNGSGKSNIADAVRWVLGEQSVKSLRGGKMEDVIFAGSEKRKSLGMAEVSLTIDNSSGIFPLEFSEITVTRRLYRSGESDYLINRVPCRLKDIHELFMDTGVGREGISIIGQGMVDEILSVKPEDRRGIIEEAAGIVKYRHRKKEAVRKLEDTENSLVRLNDIVEELNYQKEPLKEQARIAQIYKEQKKELDDLEIGLLSEEYGIASRRLQKIMKSKIEQEQDLEESSFLIVEKSAAEEEEKLKLQKMDEKIGHQQEKIYTESLLLEKNESENKLLNERIADISKQRKALGNDVLELKGEILGLNEEQNKHSLGKEKLEIALENSQRKLIEYEKYIHEDQAEDSKWQNELDELQKEHFRIIQEEAACTNELNSIKNKLDEHKNNSAEIEAEEIILKKEKKDTDQNISEIDSLLQKIAKEKNNLIQEIRQKENVIKELEEKRKLIQQNYNEMKDEMNSAIARKKVMAEMEESGQGYPNSVRDVLEAGKKNILSSDFVTVGQIIQVQKEYEIAVEVALGSAMQFVITKDEELAQFAVEWLKKLDKGRVTFLPLSTIKGRKAEIKQGNEHTLGLLCDFIKCEKKYEIVLEHLAGRIFLARNMDDALRMSRKTAFTYRVVTLDGQLVNSGGSITGGSFRKNNSSPLTRKRVLGELSEIIKTKNIELLEIEQKLYEINNNMESAKRDLGELNSLFQQAQVKHAESAKSLEYWNAEKVRISRVYESIMNKKEGLMVGQDDLLQRIFFLEQNSLAQKKNISIMQENIQELQEKIRTKRFERMKKNEHLTELRIEVATAEEKLNAHQKENGYLIQRANQLDQYKNTKEQRMGELKNERVAMEKSLSEIEKQRQLKLKRILEMERHKETLKNEKHNMLTALEKITAEIKELEKALREKQEKLHQYDVQKSKYEAAIEGLEQRLMEQFGFNVREEIKVLSSINDRRKSQLRITELKKSILELGDVNLAAIEEYRRINERIEFLTKQIGDMAEAKEKLQLVIREMNQIMTKKFKETYEKLDKAFQEMFVKLFNGGKAQLILTDEQNLLEAGVEIIAQPPGKKTQYLSLLSGGEKSLTAIALLMAVLKVKPSPFCILDEIESNLDESNVNSFAEMLREFANSTQFIVISHRKGTMEIAHVLYGVTIEETGVSSLISVKLEDAQKTAS